MTIDRRFAALIVILIILGGVLILRFTGLWITEGKKIPTKIETSDGEEISNPADIKGSYGFSDIEEHFGIPAATLAQAFNLDTVNTDPSTYQAKSIEANYAEAEDLNGDIGTDAVRTFVALYNGVPFTGEEDTILPSTAVDILLLDGRISQQEADTLNETSYKVTVSETPGAPPAPAAVPSESSAGEEQVIKGKTTFADVIGWGVPVAEIEKVIGRPVDKSTEVIRDFATAEGVEFSIWKTPLQELVDNL